MSETEQKIIQPTVGRVVWYRGAKVHARPDEERDKRAAIIACVHDDRMVNLCVIDPHGHTMAATSVVLRQPEDAVPDGNFCEWMPYQVGQAAKTEDLHAALSKRVDELEAIVQPS